MEDTDGLIARLVRGASDIAGNTWLGPEARNAIAGHMRDAADLIEAGRPSATPAPTCGTCRHWDRGDPPHGVPPADQLGLCRAHPPTLLPESGHLNLPGVWPLTRQGARCGEHQPK